MRKIAALCLVSLFLLSCVGVDSTMTIKDNGSGTLVLSYRVAQMFAHLGESTSGASAIPLPVARADFDRAFAASQGKVRLTRFDKTENEKDIVIRAEIAFDSLDSLAQVDAFKDADLKSTVAAGGHTFSQTIAKSLAQPISAETQRMMDDLLGDYALSFTIQAPSAIQSTTLGALSADKRTLTYSAKVKDVVSTTSDIVLSFSW